MKGIEPSYSAWKAAALPLSYTRACAMHYHAAARASTGMPPIIRPQQCLQAALATEYGAVQSSENSENSARVNRQPRGLARFGASPG